MTMKRITLYGKTIRLFENEIELELRYVENPLGVREGEPAAYSPLTPKEKMLLARIVYDQAVGKATSFDDLKRLCWDSWDTDKTDATMKKSDDGAFSAMMSNIRSCVPTLSKGVDPVTFEENTVTSDVLEFRRKIQSFDESQLQQAVSLYEKAQGENSDALLGSFGQKATDKVPPKGEKPVKGDGKKYFSWQMTWLDDAREDIAELYQAGSERLKGIQQGSDFYQGTLQQSWQDAFADCKEKYSFYTRHVERELPTLEDAKKTGDWEKSAYRICAGLVSLSVGPACETEARVLLLDDPRVAFQTSEAGKAKDCYRHVLEYGTTAGWPCRDELEDFRLGKASTASNLLMRFAAGGGILVLNVPDGNGGHEEFVVVAQKDNGPVIHAGHLVPCSGVAEQPEDWTNPLRIVCGEIAEEIRIRHRGNDNWYYPHFNEQPALTAGQCAELNAVVDNQRAGRAQLLTSDIKKTPAEALTWEQLLQRDGFPTGQDADFYPPAEIGDTKLPCPAQLIPLGFDRITIVQEGQEPKKFTGLLVLDPDFGAFDVMYAVRMFLDQPLSQLRVLDSEGDTGLYWRNVSVFRPGELAAMCNGKKARIERFFGRLTPESAWVDGLPARISEFPFINPPLRIALSALLARLFPEVGPVLPFPYQDSQEIEYQLLQD